MNLYMGIIVVVLFSVFIWPSGSEAQVEDKSIQLHGSSQFGDQDFGREGKLKKIVGFYYRTTYLSIRTRTTSAIWTCLKTVAGPCRARELQFSSILKFESRLGYGRGKFIPPPSCGKRKKRKVSNNYQQQEKKSVEDISYIMKGTLAADENIRTGKRVKVISTTYSILELTVTSPIPGSTVTVSALRAAVYGYVIPQSCFVG